MSYTIYTPWTLKEIEMATERRLTATDKRLLAMFSDGLPHTTAELGTCLYDEQANFKEQVRQRVSKLRGYLRPRGQDIVFEVIRRRAHYRRIILLVNPNDGKR